MIRVLSIFGTRPEAIKMAPVVKALDQQENIKSSVCVTGQHKEMLNQALEIFSITPDYSLNIMTAKQDLYDLTSRMLINLRGVFYEEKPDLVLVHGDTTTTLSAALSAFYEKIPVGHVEAGLRTDNLYSPWPEEANRRLASTLTQHHFVPTQDSKESLLKENIKPENIFVTGNTVVDALLLASDKIEKSKALQEKIKNNLFFSEKQKIVLVTSHRRENLGTAFKNICNAIKQLAKKHPDVSFVFPVHPNPKILKSAKEHLGNTENIHLIKPQDYLHFTYLMKKAYLILTDSGGIQEEAPSLGIPVLVMRSTTERQEAIKAGTVKLIGTEKNNIINEADKLLTDRESWLKMSRAHNPYGDGLASKRIAKIIANL